MSFITLHTHSPDFQGHLHIRLGEFGKDSRHSSNMATQIPQMSTKWKEGKVTLAADNNWSFFVPAKESRRIFSAGLLF